MAFPWTMVGFLLRFVGPSLPDIIATVKQLKQDQTAAAPPLQDPTARLQELEHKLQVQLQLIERLTIQFAQLQKILQRVLLLSLVALLLALLALGLVLFR